MNETENRLYYFKLTNTLLVSIKKNEEEKISNSAKEI